MRRGPSEAGSPALYWCACALAASFLAARFMEVPAPYGAFWKAAGIALLGVFALTRGARLAAAGLFASAVGDFVLELRQPVWVAGMAAFGVAHLLYAAAFFAILRERGAAPRGRALALAA
ncbi:MAG: lysoplasmalogenase, partial [Parvularculaceae bacterium]|nr:lysoplasmalogenase [Parvularculaceae bacterium]